MAGIFICYRREDTGPYAGRLYDRLSARFGKELIFMDIDTIQPGLDFVEVINETVGSCDTVIAIIGKKWPGSVRGRRRLDDPGDFVHLELKAALDRNIRIIPALVGGAEMPRSQNLPEALAMLARRQAIEISDTRFHQDVDRLIQALEKTLGAVNQRGRTERVNTESQQTAGLRQSPNTPAKSETAVERRDTGGDAAGHFEESWDVTRYILIPLEKTKESIFTGPIPNELLAEGAEFYLVVYAKVPETQLLERIPRKIKIASPESINYLMGQALPGVPVRPVPGLPVQCRSVWSTSVFVSKMWDPSGAPLSPRGRSVSIFPWNFQSCG